MPSQYSNGQRIRECIEFLKARRMRDGLDVDDMYALAVFAGDGVSEVRHVIDAFKGLACWDINHKMQKTFRDRFPQAHIGYLVCDAFEAIKEEVVGHYQHVFIDHTIGIYGDAGQHCEYFEMFPLAIQAVDPKGGCITISVTEQPYDYQGVGAWHDRRRGYYYPQNPADLQPEALLALHEMVIHEYGYSMEDYQIVPRLRKDWGDRMTYTFHTFYIKGGNLNR